MNTSLLLSLLVVRPQAQNLHDPWLVQYLIHQSVLDVDPPGQRTGKIPDQLLVRGRVLVGILASTASNCSALAEACGSQFLGVLGRLRGEIDLPLHQSSSRRQARSGVLSPLRIDSRIPFTDNKYSVS